MYAVATFLVVAVISLAFTKISTGALIATGLPPSSAAFQARSAFSGAGFTTTEAENVVNHPTRRKIIATTMFVGALGTPTLVVTILIGMIVPGPGSTSERVLVIGAGLFLIVIAIVNKPVTAALQRAGERYARDRLLPALSGPQQELLHLPDGFVVETIRLGQDPTDTARSLRGLANLIPGAVILGVRRDDEYFGESPIDIELSEGDELIVYGRRDRLEELSAAAQE
ncbi:MAG TPA: TrkA C-terminal domain-containing protein [Acidimicrobiales bacterium]|nr:TrkA C-terminal domain-containing protein [Acidimicrobiales bacterium]